MCIRDRSKVERIPQDLRDLYATAFEVDPNWLVECASRRQKWIDQGQSLNLYLAGASGKKLDELYKFAWLRGLKTTYYLRTMAATAAEKSTGSGGELNAVAVDGGYTQSSAAGANSISATPTMAAIDAELPATDMKFCSIDNPECESCQ